MSIPVIFDTDIDDTWALGFLLRCPELDVKLVTTDRGRPEYRAKYAARSSRPAVDRDCQWA